MAERNSLNNEMTKKREHERRILNKLIEKPVSILIDLNISPNLLTFLGLFCSLAAAFLIGLGFIRGLFLLTWIPPFLMILAGSLDIFDGEVARRINQVKLEGAYLDSNIDRISDSVIILGLMYGNLINYLVGFLIIFIMIMISYTRARAEVEGVSMKGIGLMERAERILSLVFGLIIEVYIYAICQWLTGKPFVYFFPIFMYFFLFLLLLTLAQRFYHIWQNCD